MNVYEAISDYLMNSMYNENGIASRGALAAIVTEYDALAPDWANAPDWAQWYAIDASGSVGLFGQEPEIEGIAWVIEWAEESDLPVEVGTVDLPDHIDWRCCKWHRPEVTK